MTTSIDGNVWFDEDCKITVRPASEGDGWSNCGVVLIDLPGGQGRLRLYAKTKAVAQLMADAFSELAVGLPLPEVEETEDERMARLDEEYQDERDREDETS